MQEKKLRFPEKTSELCPRLHSSEQEPSAWGMWARGGGVTLGRRGEGKSGMGVEGFLEEVTRARSFKVGGVHLDIKGAHKQSTEWRRVLLGRTRRPRDPRRTRGGGKVAETGRGARVRALGPGGEARMPVSPLRTNLPAADFRRGKRACAREPSSRVWWTLARACIPHKQLCSRVLYGPAQAGPPSPPPPLVALLARWLGAHASVPAGALGYCAFQGTVP